MTIDEAIAREREKAKEIRENIIDENNLEPYESYCIAMTARCAEEHEQLAEWLEELKRRREYDGEIIGSGTLNNEYNQGYNKALDDIVTIIKESVGMDWEWDFCFIEQIAEQLKAGGENEYNI